MELELKHLAPYLAYKLKFELLNFPIGKHIRTLELDCGHDFHFYLQNNWVRPYLRPLSDLTKEIEVNGEKFVPMDIIKTYHYCTIDSNGIVTESGQEYGVKYLPYTIVEMLISWHFDVNNLIPSDLAIDTNTLNQK